MASPFHLPVTAAQVGTYFVGQYYQVLQQQPDIVHKFYSDSSTVVRVDGNTRETASAMLQIHNLVMSLNYIGIEIKTAHSLESWNGGVLVMVSGSVHINDLRNRRKFVQTFFLAPQENGYFVLNDIFQYMEDDVPIHQHLPVAYLPQAGLDSEYNSSTVVHEPVPNYIQSRDFIVSKIEDNGVVDHYSFSDQEQLKQVSEAEQIIEDNVQEIAHSNGGSIQNSMNHVQEHLSVPVEELAAEPPKHTYASILQVSKGQYMPIVTQPNYNKTTTAPSERDHVADPTPQKFKPPPSAAVEPNTVVEDSSAVEEDSGEFKSVYVKNVPPTASTSEIAEEFKKFGKIKPDGVAIRTRKDIDAFYAFVEFEDITGVQNAIKAFSVDICGQQVYIEGRRPSRNGIGAVRGGRGRGRGRGSSYRMEGRGNFRSRRPSRGRNHDNDNDNYNAENGNNGYYRQITVQEDGIYSKNRHQFGMNRNGA
jgi:hypothetical protein